MIQRLSTILYIFLLRKTTDEGFFFYETPGYIFSH